MDCINSLKSNHTTTVATVTTTAIATPTPTATTPKTLLKVADEGRMTVLNK